MSYRHRRRKPRLNNAAYALALHYACLGWKVLPLHGADGGRCTCHKCGCGSPAKHPLTRHGVRDATCDTSIIDDWWAAYPYANVGIATGKESNLIVLDIDPRNGGLKTLRKLEKEHGILPQTLKVRTGGGGLHYYFEYELGLKSISNALGTGIDIKTDGGYVVAPPSLHIEGEYYKWLQH